ncbi:hypothetical protein CTheo_7067 [Ceratobasidium theobromae]|uniref:NAD-dependent epimerase/dehydratase domain-containing protein n=1 Tax=Ceratobasidium theobromae TaxID=1582974 RepID=A0A5N5QCL7_9AGAM|nr:hypothetical protein CTheo_7067 [Ceratobasidium theobromae]
MHNQVIMAVVQPPAKILLTGANGFFAVHAIKDLLQRGYTVVGTVRSAAKGEELVRLFPEYTDKLSYAVVPDIVKPGAFDQVIKEGGFDGVGHAASPVNAPGGTPEEYIRPAIDGSLGILESIKQHGSTVKRVVVTSSFVTMLHFQKGLKHTEEHWNDAVLNLVEQKGDKAAPGELYTASKTLAEKAVWKFMKDNEGKVSFDLATINPCLMLGEPIHAVTSRDQLTSVSVLMSEVAKPRPESELGNESFPVGHVKDVAAIHSAIFSRPDAAGHRVVAIESSPSWQDIYDALNEEPAFPGALKGNPGVGKLPDTGAAGWDTAYAKELLGRDFIGAKEMIRETEAYFQKKGWSFLTGA